MGAAFPKNVTVNKDRKGQKFESETQYRLNFYEETHELSYNYTSEKKGAGTSHQVLGGNEG